MIKQRRSRKGKKKGSDKKSQNTEHKIRQQEKGRTYHNHSAERAWMEHLLLRLTFEKKGIDSVKEQKISQMLLKVHSCN